MIVSVSTVFLLVSALQTAHCGEVCQTPACVETAARVTKSMNIDPCQDFFEFACKGWIMQNPIQPRQVSISTVHLVEQEIEKKIHDILNTTDSDKDGKPMKLARALYRTCMDTDTINKFGMKPFHDMLTKLGLPQKLPSDEEAKKLDISKIVASVATLYGINIFLGVSVNQNWTDSTKNKLMIQQEPPATQILWRYFQVPTTFIATINTERKRIKDLFEIFGAGDKNNKYANEHVDFITKIAKIMGSPTERVHKNYTQSVLTIDKVQEMTDPHGDTWNWTTFFNTLFGGTDIVVDTKNDTVHLHDVRYFVKLPSLLNKTSPGALARYVYEQLFSMYSEKMKGMALKLPRWKTCTTTVNAFFELALTAAYAEKHLDVQLKKKVMEMWTDVSASADEIITDLVWMDAEMKAHAHKKLSLVRPFVGYPEEMTNQTELNKVYEGMTVFDGRLFETYIHYHSIMRKRLLNSWKKVPDKKRGVTAGSPVSVSYMSNLNAVAIPAGVLQPPFYGNEVESLNYGAMGSILGSKLIPNVISRWSSATTKLYLQRVHCIINQCIKVVTTQLGSSYKLNGYRFQRVSVRDMAGLEIAFRAYKKFKARSEPQKALPALDKYTDEQLLFLGFAQSLCGSETDVGLRKVIQTSTSLPNRYRVIGTLQNSAEFAKAWNCSRGSPMNPANTCKIW